MAGARRALRRGRDLRFNAAGSASLAAGDYAMPFQALSLVLLGPGGSVTHDALRLLARHGTGLVAVGEGGVRLYSAAAARPRRQPARPPAGAVWADPDTASASRGGCSRCGSARCCRTATRRAARHRGSAGQGELQAAGREVPVPWGGRRYDRQNPDAADVPNQAINHAATCVEGAAMIAVAATATIPQLGFVHEDSANAFVLDIADLVRTTVTVPWRSLRRGRSWTIR